MNQGENAAMKKIIPIMLRRRVLYIVEALLSIIYIITKISTHSFSILTALLVGIGFSLLNSILYRMQKRKIVKRHGRKVKKVIGLNIVGKLAQFNICIALVFIDASLMKQTTLGRMITGRGIVENTYSVIVLDRNPAKYIDDTKNYTFGYMRGYDELDVRNLADVVSRIAVRNDASVEPTIFETEKETYYALKDGEIKAMIINENDRDHYEAMDHAFDTKTRVIKSYKIKTTSEAANKLSGTDSSYGRISVGS